MATNTSINNLFSKIIKKNFSGVQPIHLSYAAINKLGINKCLLINSGCQLKNQDGHFVAVIRVSNTGLLIFDPLGQEEIMLILFEPILRNFTQIQTNSRGMQAMSSEYCGLFSGGFLLAYFSNNVKSFFEMFNYENLRGNDKIIVQYLLNYMKKNHLANK